MQLHSLSSLSVHQIPSKSEEYEPYLILKMIWSAPLNPPVFNPLASVGDIVIHSLRRNPSKVCQICADDESLLTSEELEKMSVSVARNLGKLGLEMGDVVSVVGRNNRDIGALIFGCLLAGTPVNCLDASFGKDDLTHMFGITEPKLVVCERSNLAQVTMAIQELSMSPKVLVFGDSANTLFLSSSENEPEFTPLVLPDPSSHIALICCSSGTTGLSKGVCISHSMVVSQLLESWPTVESDVCLVFSSLYWISGFLNLLVSTVVGATRVVTEKTFSPDLQLDLIERYRVTRVFSPPSHLAQLLESPRIKSCRLDSIRLYSTGGSIVAEDLRKEFEGHLPNGVLRTAYGMTELGVVAQSVSRFKPVSVGKLAARVQAKIVDESGQQLGPNEQGQLLLKSAWPFLFYMKEESKTRTVLDDEGWFHTGDIGYFDEDEFLFIVGRSKEIIKFRGYQISPTELESFIQRETGILQVSVVGVEDLKHGTDLPALVLLSTSTEWTPERIHELTEKKLPDYKRFRGGVYFVKEWPLTPSGKVQRRELKKLVEKMYFSGSN